MLHTAAQKSTATTATDKNFISKFEVSKVCVPVFAKNYPRTGIATVPYIYIFLYMQNVIKVNKMIESVFVNNENFNEEFAQSKLQVSM